MRVSYHKELRQKAKDENKRLYTLAFTGPKGKGGLTIQGCCDEVLAGKISDLIMESFNEENKEYDA